VLARSETDRRRYMLILVAVPGLQVRTVATFSAESARALVLLAPAGSQSHPEGRP
jgi:hypothetical protein